MRTRDRFIGAWINESGLAALDTVAAAERRSRSDMIRVLLAEAIDARRRRK